MGKPKKLKYRILDQEEDSGVYQMMARLRREMPDIEQAEILLAFNYGWTRDKDGVLTYGKCRKVADFWQLFSAVDFVIELNGDVFHELKPDQQEALLFHELLHAAPALDAETGDQQETEDGRKVWRVRKHDVEEFGAVVRKFGAWKSDLDRFVRDLRDGGQLSLFPVADAELAEIDDGELFEIRFPDGEVMQASLDECRAALFALQYQALKETTDDLMDEMDAATGGSNPS